MSELIVTKCGRLDMKPYKHLNQHLRMVTHAIGRRWYLDRRVVRSIGHPSKLTRMDYYPVLYAALARAYKFYEEEVFLDAVRTTDLFSYDSGIGQMMAAELARVGTSEAIDFINVEVLYGWPVNHREYY